MSDEQNRFVYVPKWNTVHDKSCPEVKYLATEDLQFKHDLVPGAKQCPVCNLLRCLRIGARDGIREKAYRDFFDSLAVTRDSIQRLYTTLQAQTRLSGDFLIIWCREDTWKIERISKNSTRVVLWHNNYYINSNYMRVFYGGFHKQLPEGVTLSFCTALKHIDKYNPTAHIIKRKAQALQPQIAALREYLKDRDRKERQRRHSTLLTILYEFQLLWASLPWHHCSEPVREYAGFTLTTGLPSPAAFTDAYYGYLWKSRRGNYFFDVGKFNPETESFSSMFNSLGTEIKLASIMAYREIE